MNNSFENKVQKVERVSGWLRLFCLVWMWGVGLFGVFGLANVAMGKGSLKIGDHLIELGGLNTPQRLVVAVGLALAMAATLFCFHQFRSLMSLYRSREFFTLAVAGRYRLLGIGCVANGLVGIGLAVIGQWAAHVPQIKVSFGFDILISGAAFVVISWFVEMATQLREENELTV